MVRSILAVLVAALAVGCKRSHPCDFMAKNYDALPILKPIPKSGPVRLRVLYLEDNRLPTLTAEGRAALYSRVEGLVKRWFGYTVMLQEVDARPLRIEFAGKDLPFANDAQQACLDSARLNLSRPEDLATLEDMVGREYAARGAEVFERLFPEARGLDPVSARRTAAAKVRSMNAWLSGLGTKGGPLVRTEEDRRLTSTLNWMVYNRTQNEADFIITNTVMLEPDVEMPIYVMARGGVTTGLVDSNPKAPYGASGIVTLLPFLSGERLFVPAAAETTPAENLDAAATMWVHELGHFLNRYGEMYGEAGCVHVASEGLGYFKWHRAIRKADNRCSRLPAVVPKF